MAMHLADYMKLYQLDDAQVAKAIRRSRPTVSRIRRAKSRPDWDTIQVLRKWSQGTISADDFVASRKLPK
jgi:transcriptional regulator with XRE-family HTH domain